MAVHGHEPVETPPPQYTVEGQIHMLGEFASGLKRARGWRRAVAWLLFLAVLFGGVGTGFGAGTGP